MSDREEVLLEPAYVLHLRPYRNTSLIVECLTGRFGRQTLIAQGARRPQSHQRSLLQAFSPLLLSWVRRGEIGRLTHVEAAGRYGALAGDGLLAAYYLNELLLRLVPRGDQNEQILSCYSSCLDQLSEPGGVARALRLFELDLLSALGVGIDLERDFQSGEPIEPDREYLFEHESGLTATRTGTTMTSYRGQHLISLREHRLDDAASLSSARHLLGRILHGQLGERPLKTRVVARELAEFGLSG